MSTKCGATRAAMRFSLPQSEVGEDQLVSIIFHFASFTHHRRSVRPTAPIRPPRAPATQATA